MRKSQSHLAKIISGGRLKPIDRSLQNPQGERERAAALSHQNRLRRRVRRRRALIFASGNPISQSKNRFLAQFAARVFQRKLKQIVVGVVVAGERSSPARCRASNSQFEPWQFRPWAKPQNPMDSAPPATPTTICLSFLWKTLAANCAR